MKTGSRSTFRPIGEIAAELVHGLASPVPAHAVGCASRYKEGADDNANRETENGEAEQHIALLRERHDGEKADDARANARRHPDVRGRKDEDRGERGADDGAGKNAHQSAPMSRETRREKKEAVAALDTEKHPDASDDHRPKSQSPSDVGQELTGSPQPVVVFKISEHGNLYRLERLIRFCFYGRLNG